MNPFVKLWFWLLILSIIGYIVCFAAFEAVGEASDYSNIPIWIWILIGLSFAASIAALILYSMEAYRDAKQRKIDIACGRIPPPEREKIVCPVEVASSCMPSQEIQVPVVVNSAPLPTPVPIINSTPMCVKTTQAVASVELNSRNLNYLPVIQL